MYNIIANEESCNEGDLRLIGSETDHEGDLEICLFGVWSSVCDEAWTKTNSDVACRQLGFIDGGAYGCSFNYVYETITHFPYIVKNQQEQQGRTMPLREQLTHAQV